jgi:DNA-binding transcriptional LysR family regulator
VVKLPPEFGQSVPNCFFFFDRNQNYRFLNDWRSVSNTDTGHGDSQTYEHFYLSLQAACAGLGVAIGSVFMAQEEIDSGRLVAPFGFMRDGSEYFLLSPLPFDGDPHRTAFLQWMRQQMHHVPP